MKNIVISGSSGLVATQLIADLIRKGGYQIYALTTKPDIIRKRYEGIEGIICLTIKDLREAVIGKTFLALIHCAFARSKSGRDIAASLAFLGELINSVKGADLGAFINVSSQSVYGQREVPLWTEETPVDPDYLYAMGKYASEMMVNFSFLNSDIHYTNIRLASVVENARFINVFVKNAIGGLPIKVIGGNQVCSFIDVRDVSTGLISVVEKSHCEELESIYNLGLGKTQTILEIAEGVQRMAKLKYALDVVIEREESDIKLDVGMNNALFCSAFDWEPKYDYDAMIEYMFEYNLNIRGGIR